MADILELIQTRRTIKKFLPKYVSNEMLYKIIDAGRHAPSSGNLQNWKFIVVNDLDLKFKIAQACYDQLEVAEAANLIVVCAEPEKVERYYGLRGERLYSVQNCAAAIQNMILEAHSLGLGTRWIGAFEEEEVKSLCDIPENVRPQAIIAVGYAKEVPEKPPKYPLESVIFFNHWRNKIKDSSKYMMDTSVLIGRKFGDVKEAASSTVESVAGGALEKMKKISLKGKDFVVDKVRKRKDKSQEDQEEVKE
jgi:nitroreductase